MLWIWYDGQCFFIKYKQVFDSIYRYQPQRSLKSYGIPNKITNFAKMMLSPTSSKVMAWNQDIWSFRVGAGVRQDDALLAIPVLLVCVFYLDSGYASWCTTLVVVAEAAITEVVAVGAATSVTTHYSHSFWNMKVVSTTCWSMTDTQVTSKFSSNWFTCHFGNLEQPWPKTWS